MKASLFYSVGVLALVASATVVMGSDKGQAPPMDLSKYKPYSPKADEGDFVISPPYSNAPELTPRSDVPKGKVFHIVMDSTDSKIYPGIIKTAPGKITPYKRNVTVYVPSQYAPGTQAPFFVSQDSMGRGEMPTILDNMIADHRVPAMIGVFIDSGGSDAQGSQRGLEYDTLSPWYAQFVESEVLPRVAKECNVEFTKNPDARMTMGGSSGGACAFTMAWYRPDLYHRVLTYSGTYVNQAWPPDPQTLHGAWEYHEHLIPQSRRKPIRLWMEVGANDLRPNDPESTLHNWPLANVKMASVLKAKGYHYQFVFAYEANHVDGRVVRQTLPQALEWVWKGYHGR